LSLSDRVVVMNAGRMEQVGTPFEIYNFPQTAFVANFVGTLNAVEAKVIDPKANTLQIDGTQLQAAQGLEARMAGERVMVAIRPERFSFASEQKKANVLDAVIENVTFLGSIVRVQVNMSGMRFYMDTFNNPYLELPKIGDQTQITCSREAVLVLNH
jgi:putative spermidine/putrescine transport system ATP-binding protein